MPSRQLLSFKIVRKLNFGFDEVSELEAQDGTLIIGQHFQSLTAVSRSRSAVEDHTGTMTY